MLQAHHRDGITIVNSLKRVQPAEPASIPSMATCAAVTVLLSTLSSVLYLTGAAETTPVAAGGLKQQYALNKRCTKCMLHGHMLVIASRSKDSTCHLPPDCDASHGIKGGRHKVSNVV